MTDDCSSTLIGQLHAILITTSSLEHRLSKAVVGQLKPTDRRPPLPLRLNAPLSGPTSHNCVVLPSRLVTPLPSYPFSSPPSPSPEGQSLFLVIARKYWRVGVTRHESIQRVVVGMDAVRLTRC